MSLDCVTGTQPESMCEDHRVVKNSLLASLSGLFREKPENVVVAALEHVLHTSSTARRVLTGLASMGTNPPTVTAYKSQLSDDGTRPAIVGINEAGSEVVIIEAKFWAGLTDQQPQGYLERLRSSDNAVLCFIVPDSRRSSLWPEVIGRLGIEDPQQLGDGLATFDIAVDESRRLTMITWSSLLQAMTEATQAAGDLSTAHDIEQLAGLADHLQHEGFIPFSSQDLGQDAPRLINQLVDVAYETVQTGVARGHFSMDGMRSANTWFRYTRYFAVNDLGLSLSVHYLWWKDLGHSPIWLHLQGDRDSIAFEHFTDARTRLQKLESALPPKMIVMDDGFPVFPLELLCGVDFDQVVESLTEQVVKIVELLKSVE